MQSYATEAYLSALIDSTVDEIWAVDLDFKMVAFNRAAAQSFESHYGRPIFPGMRHDEQLPSVLGRTWADFYQRVISQGPFRIEYTFADGRTRDLSFSPIILDGAVTGISVLSNDITERKAEEKARLEAERKYRDIFDGALEGIFQVSPDGQLLAANPALATILGYDSPEEVVALINYRQTVWVDPEKVSKYLQMLEETGVLRRFEMEARRKDGAIIWVSFNSRKTFAIDGKTPIIEGFMEDITDRKLAELRISERDNKLREAEALAHMGYFSWNPESRTTTWSEGVYEIAGWDSNQPGPNDYERTKLYSPEDWKKLDDAARHTVATGDPCDLELQMIRRDGALRWVRILGEAARNESGCLDRLFGTVQDITQQKLNEMALRDSEERFRATFEQAAVGMLHVSFEGRILGCNKRFAEIIGYSSEEVVGMKFQELMPQEYLPESNQILNEFETGNINEIVFEKPSVRKDGSLIWVRLTISVQRDGKGQLLHLLTFVEDISDRKLAEEHLAEASKELQASAAFHRTVFQTSLDALHITRFSDDKLVDVNKAFLDFTGFQREEAIGRTPVELGVWVDPSERQRVRDELRHNSSIRDVEMLFRRKNGETYWALLSASMLEYEGVPHLFVATRDLSEAKEAIKMIRDLAFYDPLTHLPNRRSLLDLLEQTDPADPRLRALLFVDLDKFKSLNDALGSHAGDLLLQEAAQRLAACVRGNGTVARLGGDEFAIVLENQGNTAEHAADQAEQIGQRILAAAALPYLVGESECHFSASIGITVFGSDLKNRLQALQQGEIAMSKAKEAGRNTIRFFSPELQAIVNARALLENELRKAIKEEEFELYFQPQVRGGRLIGSEALLRWHHPQRGVLAPGAFIELAEDIGLILPLGNWVFENACEHVTAWAGKNRSGDTPVAVNISGKQFSQSDFVATVLAILDRTGANPASIKVELTETSVVTDFHDAVAKMTELKSHGLKFSLDDFGTGYSSLAYLRSLPLDQLKIDRAFVKDILVDGPSGAIAQAIISMGHAMGFSVIAEGVETEEQRDFLIGIGCDCFQGDLYSRPVPADELERTWFLCG